MLLRRATRLESAPEGIPELVEICDLDKQWLPGQAKDAAWQIIESLGYLDLLGELQVKSPVTFNHCTLVADIIVEDFVDMGIDDVEYLAKAYVAAILHDIGKLDDLVLPLVESREAFRFDDLQKHKLLIVSQGHTLSGPEKLQNGAKPRDTVERRARDLATIVSRYHHTDAETVLELAKSLDDKSLGFIVLAIQVIDRLQAGTDLNRGYIAERVRDGEHDLVYLDEAGELAIRKERMLKMIESGLGSKALAFYPALAKLAATDLRHYPTRPMHVYGQDEHSKPFAV